MKAAKQWTEDDFLRYVGYKPIQDDLERVNCDEADKLGHQQCGVCKHNMPKFLYCAKCRYDNKTH